MKPTWQRLILAAPFLLALNFAVCVYTILSEKESFISILNLSSFAITCNLLCPPFFLKQKLECEKAYVQCWWLGNLIFSIVFALPNTSSQQIVFLLLFSFLMDIAL